MLRIQLAEIPEEGLQVHVNDLSWFPEREFTRSGKLRADVELHRHGERAVARAEIDMTLNLICDRCLEEYKFPWRLAFKVTFEFEDVSDLVSKEYECDLNDMDVILLDEPVIDLGSALRQQVILAAPGKKLCSEGCHGLCRKCGKNLNQEQCCCEKGEQESPFSVLGKLLKDKE